MPPKRRTEAVAEPSPAPKKRNVKSTATSKKRTRDEDDAAPGRRKKKVADDADDVADAEEDETPVAAANDSPNVPVSVTPKGKPGRKSLKAETPKTTTPRSIGKAKKAPVTPSTVASPSISTSQKSPIQQSTEKSSRGRKESATSPTHAANGSSKMRAVSPLKPVSSSASSPRATNTVEDEPQSDDQEILSLFDQAWAALSICLKIVGPLFLAIIIGCYVMGVMQQSQAIASVGVVYTFLLVAIIGSYVVVILPCILVSRIITILVTPSSDAYAVTEVNFYSRVFYTFAALAALLYYGANHV